jgi:hypothetical protein
VEDRPDLNDDTQGEIGADVEVVPGAVDSPTSSDNITINQMMGASRSKRNLIKVFNFSYLLHLHVYMQYMYIEAKFVNLFAVYTKGLP